MMMLQSQEHQNFNFTFLVLMQYASQSHCQPSPAEMAIELFFVIDFCDTKLDIKFVNLDREGCKIIKLIRRFSCVNIGFQKKKLMKNDKYLAGFNDLAILIFIFIKLLNLKMADS